MKRIRIVGLALVAVFALGAVAASAASAALPEFGRCVKLTGKTGKYTNSTCTTESSKKEGEFEFEEVSKKSFTSSSGEGTLETASGTKVTCKEDTDKGQITAGFPSKTVEKVVVTFKGCKESIFKAACQSGSTSGEIVTKELKGELGYINKSKTEVGLDLKPASGELFVEFNCTGGLVKVKVRGSLIGKASPVNTMSSTGELIYKQTGGKQEFTKFEGGSEDILESSKNGEAFEKSGETTSDKITYEESIETKA